MMQIRSVSYLRNKFSENENITINEYVAMADANLKEHSNLTDYVEIKLNEVDYQAEHSNIRLSHEDAFESIRKEIHKN